MIRHMRKKSVKRRLLAWLGIRHTSKKYYFIYFLALIALIILFPLIMKTLTGIKENYGKGYGYVPRDLERVEKLKREGKAIPLLPAKRWQHKEGQGPSGKEKSILDPYR